jgi:hypothetical protein
MNALASRLARIESLKPPCQHCKGKGRLVVSEVTEHETIPDPATLEGCSVCGCVQHMVIRYVHESAHGHRHQEGLDP